MIELTNVTKQYGNSLSAWQKRGGEAHSFQIHSGISRFRVRYGRQLH